MGEADGAIGHADDFQQPKRPVDRLDRPVGAPARRRVPYGGTPFQSSLVLYNIRSRDWSNGVDSSWASLAYFALFRDTVERSGLWKRRSGPGAGGLPQPPEPCGGSSTISSARPPTWCRAFGAC